MLCTQPPPNQSSPHGYWLQGNRCDLSSRHQTQTYTSCDKDLSSQPCSPPGSLHLSSHHLLTCSTPRPCWIGDRTTAFSSTADGEGRGEEGRGWGGGMGKVKGEGGEREGRGRGRGEGVGRRDGESEGGGRGEGEEEGRGK